MSRIKKTTSVLTIVLFIGMLVAPFLNANECDMDCCLEENTTHCGLEMVTDACCPIVTECKDTVFIPIVSAPIIKVNIEKDLTTEYSISEDMIPNSNFEFSAISYHIKTDISAPPGFQTPLLV